MFHHFNWFLTEELKRNLVYPENEITAVKNKNFNDTSTTIHEQIDPILLFKEEFFSDVIDIIYGEKNYSSLIKSISHCSNSLKSTKTIIVM